MSLLGKCETSGRQLLFQFHIQYQIRHRLHSKISISISIRRVQLNVLNPSGSCYKNVQFVADNWLLCSLASGFWDPEFWTLDADMNVKLAPLRWLSLPWPVVKLSSKIDKSRKGCANYYCYYYDYYKLAQLLLPLKFEQWVHGEKSYTSP